MTCTANRFAATKPAARREDLAGDHRISGGSSERLAKLLAVIPIGPSGPAQVITVTPVG